MEKVFPRRRHREGTEEEAPKRTPQSSRRRRNIMAWYDSAVFYHIYPLGLCGCARENKGEPEEHFDQLTAWADRSKRFLISLFLSCLMLSFFFNRNVR